MSVRRRLVDPKSTVIAIGGLHGTGKSTYARVLAEEFGLRHVSAGQIFRETAKQRNVTLQDLNELARSDPRLDQLIDQKTKEEATKGGVIIDGQLAAAMAGQRADLRILITSPERVRIERISLRDSIPFEEALEKTIQRERAERERYMNYYGIDVTDSSIYDVVVDSSLTTIEETTKILKSVVGDYIAKQSRR
jgi:cytidylate kinase